MKGLHPRKLLLLFFILFIQCTQQKEQPVADEIEIDPYFLQLPVLHYGIAIDSFDVARGTVRWNQNLSEILTDFNVSYQDLHVLSERSRDIFDVRKLKAGSSYSIIYDRDSLKTARQFIFEPSPLEYVVYHLKDSIYVDLHQKPTEIRKRTIAAEINSSLYQSIVDQGGSPELVDRLVDVYAWQVDFFKIAKGDVFKVIYDEVYVDNQPVAVNEIEGAYFKHWGKPYYAIPFDTDEKKEYFDEEGKSLRKTFLKAPLKYDRISSRYSLRRFHPVQKRYKAHLGTDYAARTGTPIRTVGDGVVLAATYHGGNGNYVKIKHNSNYTTQYLHMSKIARGIRPGVRVKQGQTIGYVGSTGLANGPHLCFRFWKNGRQVDALKVDLPSSGAIAANQMEAFDLLKNSLLSQLDSLQILQNADLIAEKDEEWRENATP